MFWLLFWLWLLVVGYCWGGAGAAAVAAAGADVGTDADTAASAGVGAVAIAVAVACVFLVIVVFFCSRCSCCSAVATIAVQWLRCFFLRLSIAPSVHIQHNALHAGNGRARTTNADALAAKRKAGFRVLQCCIHILMWSYT